MCVCFVTWTPVLARVYNSLCMKPTRVHLRAPDFQNFLGGGRGLPPDPPRLHMSHTPHTSRVSPSKETIL